jgi:hypothetical protein
MDGMILKRGSGGFGNLKTIDEHYVATEGQTVFPIAYETFDYKKDTVFVTSGRTSLSEGLDYTVESQKVVLNEGVPEGRTITIRIMKNVNTDVEDKTMSGVYIEEGSMPLDRLAENVVEEENLPTKIQSLLTGGEISMVKSVQRGVITMSQHKGTSKTATINSVNVNKSVVLYGGYSTNADNYNQPYIEIRLELTNSTTVTASVGNDTYTNNVIPYQVIEYY